MVWNGFKPYACAIDMHSPIDALTRILDAHSLRPQDIAEIVVPLPHVPMEHSGAIGPEPHDIVGAQHSMHFALGLTVVKRANDFNTYLDAWKSDFKDPDVLAAAHKVSVVEIPGSENTGTAETGSLSVKTTDEKTYAERLLPSKGSPKNPMTYEELEHKFMSLATRALPQEHASKIAATIRDLEKVEDLGELTDLLVSRPSRTVSPNPA
jgi:2-methylcitrate dehydratase PrpD